jgi:glycosyltransferase involved in cell wall biosynthesis
MSENTPLVSVCCITYNHAQFIRTALDGFLMQKTDFPFETIVHDDCSTDGTAEIVKGYQEQHPDLIKAILQTENQRSKGKKVLSIALGKARGKYIALCEGDDYWTVFDKLQIQVNYLEKQAQCSACFHNTLKVYEDHSQPSIEYCQNLDKELYDFEDLLVTYILHTSASMFRHSLIETLPEWVTPLKMADWPLHILLSLQGPIGYINQVMSVYRIHAGGVWSGSNKFDNRKAIIQMFGALSANLGPIYQKSIDQRLATLIVYTGADLIEAGLAENLPIKASIRRAENILVNEILTLLSSNQDQRKFKSKFYAGMGFACYKIKELQWARYCLIQSVRLDKEMLKDRGVWSIVSESVFGSDTANLLRKFTSQFK